MILLAALLNRLVEIWLNANGVRVAGVALEAGSKSCPASFGVPTLGPLVNIQRPLPLKAAVDPLGTFSAHSEEKFPPRSAGAMVCSWLTVCGCLNSDS